MSKPVIICVDDEPTVLESLKIELKRVLGDTCLIETAEGADEALELFSELRRDEYEIALVLADYIMPNIKGDELLGRIHTLSPHTLNIMVSGHADLEAVGNAIRHARLYRYIPKPWQADDLRSTVIEAVQSYLQDRKLDAQNEKLLRTNLDLEQSVNHLRAAETTLKRQAEREQALNRMMQAIRNSLDLHTVFSTAVAEVGKLLQIDQVKIFRYFPDDDFWRVVAASCSPDTLSAADKLEIPAANNPISARLQRLEMVQIIDASLCHDEINQNLAKIFPGSWLIVPLDFEAENSQESADNNSELPMRGVWGCLCLIRQPVSLWQDWEIEIVRTVADQLAIAIQQSELYQQVQQLNAALENQVQQRTGELQQALVFEALLKRITDKVRDSLDECQILQTAVQELALGLDLASCDTGLYDLEQETSTVEYEYLTTPVISMVGMVVPMARYPAIYKQLLQGDCFQFCWLRSANGVQLQPHKVMGHSSSVLACPLVDDSRVIGDLWLHKADAASFSMVEVRLVQQVANQCVIALRQSRLYQTTLAQVEELERLNRLKDDFLSSVSHELRSPMANIKMATQMLELNLRRSGILAGEPTAIGRYVQILRDECQRETDLINDLLDLARLEAGNEVLCLTEINLQDWLAHLAEPFTERTRDQQQQFILDIPAQVPVLATDVSFLGRAVTELMHNACKYTPAGETIRVAVSTTRAEIGGKSEAGETASYVHSPVLPQPTITIVVANSGIEIAPEERDRIFDKFYRIPNNDPWKHGGTGLGLALVKRQIERLQGRITVTSEQRWTMFSIHLPLTVAVGQAICPMKNFPYP